MASPWYDTNNPNYLRIHEEFVSRVVDAAEQRLGRWLTDAEIAPLRGLPFMLLESLHTAWERPRITLDDIERDLLVYMTEPVPTLWPSVEEKLGRRLTNEENDRIAYGGGAMWKEWFFHELNKTETPDDVERLLLRIVRRIGAPELKPERRPFWRRFLGIL